MMGCNHAVSGGLVGLATLSVAPVDTPAGMAVWVLGWSGTALLPDLDSAGSSAARMWGPPTRALGGVLGHLAQGHRRGTHDLLLAPAIFAAAAWVASWWQAGQTAVIALLIGLAVRAIAITGGDPRLRGVLANLAISWAGAWWLVGHSLRTEVTGMIPWLIAGGTVVHILGDALTRSGVPVPVVWLWDPERTWALRWFRTGKGFEVAVLTPVLNLALLGMIAWRVDAGQVLGSWTRSTPWVPLP